MSTDANSYSIRECAADLSAVIERSRGDADALASGMAGPMAKLMGRTDLLEVGLPRQGNNVAFSRYLYFDGDMTMIIFQVPKDKPIQPHDHGIWESLFVYKGKLKHTMYRRADKGDVAGYADLTVVRDGVLERGDCAIVAPPDDIHGFVALTDDTYGISVVKGEYKPVRNYYTPDKKEVVARQQVTSR